MAKRTFKSDVGFVKYKISELGISKKHHACVELVQN
jgi:hypothetical protein